MERQKKKNGFFRKGRQIRRKTLDTCTKQEENTAEEIVKLAQRQKRSARRAGKNRYGINDISNKDSQGENRQR